MIIRSLFLSLLLFTSASFAQTLKTGEFVIEASPTEILGSDAVKYSSNIGVDDIISWEVYVPENYDPNKPAGIMVFAGSPQNVRAPFGWLSVMKDKNLIWVAARKSGNASSIHQKKLLAMMSVPIIEEKYNIDKNRIYITGEGRTAGRAVLDYPQMFTGAIFMGDRVWEDNADDKVKAITNNRYVFVTREKTAFPKGTRYAYNKFRKSGVTNSKIVLIQGRHRYNRPKFSKSIDYLDG
ncbi:MAG: hypothetical protein JKY84_01135 [Emcibacteraceae bacterium]|nr:hypothetical protein [Emcibacteraceae bacterium]